MTKNARIADLKQTCHGRTGPEKTVAAAAILASVFAGEAMAVEGGSGAYLLGSRDFAMGIVPPPGFYESNDFVYYEGSVAGLAIGGVAVANANLDVFIYKAAVTYVPETQLLGGRIGVNVTLPWAAPNMDFTGAIFMPPIAGVLSDSETGLGDLTVTPMIGWDNGNWHYNIALSLFLPTGKYDTASVSLGPPVSVDVLSIGKNKFAVDPTFGVTYLNPQTGLEFSAALGVTINAENTATNYLTAPELHLEALVGQRFANGLAIGLEGYAYQQLGNDSGSGARSTQARLGAKTLSARVFGIGPAISWSTKVGDVGVNVKAKYIHEFGAMRRFEGDAIFGNISFAF